MRSLQSEYSGRACAALIHEFESQGGREPPVRARNSGDSGDRRALHVLPPNVTRHNDGRLHAEHIYKPKTKGFYLKQLQTKSESYRTGLLFHLKGAHVGFEKCLEGVCRHIFRLPARTLTTSRGRTWTGHSAQLHISWPGRLEVHSSAVRCLSANLSVHVSVQVLVLIFVQISVQLPVQTSYTYFII